MTMLERVRDAVRRQRLLSKGDKVVLGVSGGPDSVAMLYILSHLSKEWKIAIHIAHLDHMLRKDSHEDSAFVEKLALKLGLPFTCGRINVGGLAKSGSVEEIGRKARLGFLFGVARDIKARKIALGHTLDDQAETVLMRIIRGTGLYGLSAILPKREIAGFTIIRPLLGLRRFEIEGYLKKKKIRTLTDPSNSEDIYFRNRIRGRLMPLLEKGYNRNIKEALANLAASAAYDYDYLWSAACKKAGANTRRINIKKFLRLPVSLQRLTLRLYIQRLNGDTRRLTFKHISDMEDLIFNRPVNSVLDLPRGLSFAKRHSCLVFYKKSINA